jgi:hypothetical protein
MYTKSAVTRATGENQYALGRVLGLEVSLRDLEPISPGTSHLPVRIINEDAVDADTSRALDGN